jgi:hypothetical protein
MNTDDRYKGELKPEKLRDFIARNDEARGKGPTVAFVDEAGELQPVRRATRIIPGTSKYMPHQGARERARRMKQSARG